MKVFAIPVGDKFILYRPLRRLAFVGNQAMADIVMSLATQARRGSLDEGGSQSDLPPDVLSYLQSIGFLEPDPPPPPPRDPGYHPTSAVILATNRCNLRCVYCYADAGSGAVQDVPLELTRKVIDGAYQNAVEAGRPYFELTFHGGGEPTLAWETLVQGVAYARAKDLPCRVSVVSNGLWTAHRRAWILSNLDSLTISFDGTRETQDGQRPRASGRGTFDAVMESIRALDEQGFDYALRMTALGPWQGRLARDVGFLCAETGCKYIRVEPAFNTERGYYQSPSAQESEDFVAGFMEAFEVAKRAGRGLVYSGARPYLLTSTFCSAPFGGLIVTPAGDLVTCYEVTSSQHPLAEMCTIGRIEDGQVIVDWEKREVFLSRLEARREACRECFCYWHCAGDCHVKAFYPGAEADPGSSLRCHVNRSITAQMLLWHIADSEDGVWRDEKRYVDGREPGPIQEEDTSQRTA